MSPTLTARATTAAINDAIKPPSPCDLEIERIAEGERYMSRLLTDRALSPVAERAPVKIITPH
jgi:hypothetical protein